MVIHEQDHPCFPQPSNPSTTVWRYFDFPKFVWFLQNQKLFFSRANLLGDSHEGSLPLATYADTVAFFREHGAEHVTEGLSKARDALRSSVYVNCWTLGDDESEAMWQIYCGRSQGVAIRTSYQVLFDTLKRADQEILVGLVRYIDYDQDFFPPGNVLYPFMHKRRAFEHEHEVRAVKANLDCILESSDSRQSGVEVPISVPELVQKIHVHPNAEVFFYNVVIGVIAKYFPEIESRVSWSLMRRIPLY